MCVVVELFQVLKVCLFSFVLFGWSLRRVWAWCFAEVCCAKGWRGAWLADWSLRRGWLRPMRGWAWCFVLLLFF